MNTNVPPLRDVGLSSIGRIANVDGDQLPTLLDCARQQREFPRCWSVTSDGTKLDVVHEQHQFEEPPALLAA